jgi:hypothetical protein
MESYQVRAYIQKALELDLIGPNVKYPEYHDEILIEPPSQWYLTGFLVPFGSPIESRADSNNDEGFEVNSHQDIGEEENIPEKSSSRKVPFPSSVGLSFFIFPEETNLDVIVNWGEYEDINKNIFAENENEEETEAAEPIPQLWKRTPRREPISINISKIHGKLEIDVPESKGLKLFVSYREMGYSVQQGFPEGTKSVSIFLVNHRLGKTGKQKEESYIFQASFSVSAIQGFVPRPDMRGQDSIDQDEAIASLQYRYDFEYVVGHNISAEATLNNGICDQVYTAWIPGGEVPRVDVTDIPGLELDMEALANAADADTIISMISPMVTAYTDWINNQNIPQTTGLAKTARDLLANASRIKDRITAGLEYLRDDTILQAFQIANRAIAISRKQRTATNFPQKWRPFQLAFILLNIVSISQPEHYERKIVDLLFFPTGGGKTEAYLGLAAFTLVLRRLRDPSIYSAGVTVLMRYTLRLLTLDQLERASTLICALELERQANPDKLGKHPFEIGLWVGGNATPNKMGKKGKKDENSAREKTEAYVRDEKHTPKPIPLEKCPWCGTNLNKSSFNLYPNNDYPSKLRLICTNRACKFRKDNPLPIIAVDEQIYRSLPCFIIATVDKFATLPWLGDTAVLFGKVTHYDETEGFSSYATLPSKVKGKKLQKHLPPPDLIIQDELHLISGPLGTMVGLYETAIDKLSEISYNGNAVYPKIIASTATVKRADKQIQALFARNEVNIFPPPGINRHDSFFAATIPLEKSPGRLYLGVAAQGRSFKVVLLRVYLALLGAAGKLWKQEGGKKNPHNPADPYMTLLGYFNSLRELGGCRRLVEDEVTSRINQYGTRCRYNEQIGLFVNRKIDDVPEELTSRVSTSEIAETKQRLSLSFSDQDQVDLALATNMISVGLDITRLGLMVVLGQPKTAAEYIQATSRVGRDASKPGLVVTLLNIHRPRDRSHYERFSLWHSIFYRFVEATSVTPFSPRALDRGLAGVTVALSRLNNSTMTAPQTAAEISRQRPNLDFVIETIINRVTAHNPETDINQENIKNQINNLFDIWEKMANETKSLQYQTGELDKIPALLMDTIDIENKRKKPEEKFAIPRSLRDVEPIVQLVLRDNIDPA